MLNKKQRKIKNFSRFIVLFLIFISSVINAIPQDLKPDEKLIEEKGISHFNEGEYTKALFYFNRLLEIYPKDPFFSYYTGVSLVETENQIDEAIYRLKIASLKDVPENVFFYLGKANHIKERYNDAIKYYERFIEVGENDEIEELQAQRLLRMCNAKVNPEAAKPEVEKIDSKSDKIEVETREVPEAGKKQKTSGYDELVDEALKWQIKADSVRRKSNESRQSLPQISNQAEREKVKNEILGFEEEAYNYQTKADSLYSLVKNLEQELKNKPEPDSTLLTSEQKKISEKEEKFLENIEKMKPFKKQQTSDNFYNNDDYGKFFRSRDIRKLNEGENYIEEGDDFMREVSALQEMLEKEKIRISSLTSKRERRKSNKNISKLEKKIKRKVIYASKYYQEGNATKYLIFNEALDNWNADNINIRDEKKNNALKFQNLADDNMDKAVELTKKGNDAPNEEEKFDYLLKANAYEIMALNNQKKAFDIYAGKAPVRTKVKLAAVTGEPDKLSEVEKDTVTIAPEEETDIEPVTEKNAEEKNILPVKEEQKKAEEDVVSTTTEEKKPESPPEKITKTETVSREKEANEEAVKSNKLAYSFQILRRSPYSEDNPFPADKEFPGKLVYRIQIAAFSNPVSYDYFKGLVPITTEKVANSNITRYFAGLFKTYEAARSVLDDVRKEGFSDAYIVAHFNGRKVSLNRAKNLENY